MNTIKDLNRTISSCTVRVILLVERDCPRDVKAIRENTPSQKFVHGIRQGLDYDGYYGL